MMRSDIAQHGSACSLVETTVSSHVHPMHSRRAWFLDPRSTSRIPLCLSCVILLAFTTFPIPCSGESRPDPDQIIAGGSQPSAVDFGSADTVHAAVLKAMQLAHRREFLQAETILRGILTRRPNETAALYQLAVVLSWDDQYDESLKAYRLLLQQQPTNVGLHFEIGRVLIWQAHETASRYLYQEAITEFRDLLNHRPNHVTAMKLLAQAYLGISEPRHAREHLKVALSWDPLDAEAACLLADAVCMTEGREQAVEVLWGHLENSSDATMVRWKLAEMLTRDGRLDEAAAQHKAILETDRAHLGSLLSLGNIMLWKGKLPEAEAYFRSAARSAPKSADPLLGLAQVDVCKGHWKDAARSYREAFEMRPQAEGFRSALRQMGWLSSSGFDLESVLLEPSRGLRRESYGGGFYMHVGQSSILRVGYTQSLFSEGHSGNLRRDDSWLDLSLPMTTWLVTKLRLIYSYFPAADADPLQGTLGWSGVVEIKPLSEMTLYGSVSHRPTELSLATIGSEYYTDTRGLGLDVALGCGLSIQASSSLEYPEGTYPIGYWNDYWKKWVTLEHIADESEHELGSAQVSLQISHLPAVHLRYRYDIRRVRGGSDLPYWVPSDYSQQTLSVDVAKADHGVFQLGVECHGSRVNEGSRWGGGGTAWLAVRVANRVELRIGGGLDRVGTSPRWESSNLRASFHVR
ncbi:MAG: tetratricopeptide repeat protein [Candidatus Eisenbacteria sp.]|nr:tetratricopeptide repeat protein [Candidatus Eisenbacteria bacterium]